MFLVKSWTRRPALSVRASAVSRTSVRSLFGVDLASIRAKVSIGAKLQQKASDMQKEYNQSIEEANAARDRSRELKQSVFDLVPAADRPPVTFGPVMSALNTQRGSTTRFKTSHRRLNELALLIANRPIDYAILQMELSDKAAARRVKSMLALTRDHAVARGIPRDRLVVAQAWVNKGRALKRLDIKGRGRRGVKHHVSASLHVLLAQGKTHAEMKRQEAEKMVKDRLRATTMQGWLTTLPKPVINMGRARGQLAHYA